MALDKGQLASLKRLMQDDGWDVLTGIILADRIYKLNSHPITGSNEFETLRELHNRQGKVDGLKDFFDDVEKMAFDD